MAKLGRRLVFDRQLVVLIDSLLGSTHAQVEEYSRRRTDEISEAVKGSIDKIVHTTQVEQQQLLDDAHKQSLAFETDYQKKLLE